MTQFNKNFIKYFKLTKLFIVFCTLNNLQTNFNFECLLNDNCCSQFSILLYYNFIIL